MNHYLSFNAIGNTNYTNVSGGSNTLTGVLSTPANQGGVIWSCPSDFDLSSTTNEIKCDNGANIIAAIKSVGGVVFIPHPNATNTSNTGYYAMSIWNEGMESGVNKIGTGGGNFMPFWESKLRAEYWVNGGSSTPNLVACFTEDDYTPFTKPLITIDPGRTFVSVLAKSCESPSILNSLRFGRFWSYRGPAKKENYPKLSLRSRP